MMDFSSVSHPAALALALGGFGGWRIRIFLEANAASGEVVPDFWVAPTSQGPPLTGVVWFLQGNQSRMNELKVEARGPSIPRSFG